MSSAICPSCHQGVHSLCTPLQAGPLELDCTCPHLAEVAARDQIHRSAVLLQAAQVARQRAEVDKEHAQTRWREEERKLVAVRAELLAARSELKSSVAPAVPTTGRLQCPDCAAARDQLASVRSQLQLAFAWNASEGDRLRTELQKAHAELRKRINPEADMICASVLP